jgi:hypothetical protein
MKRVTSGYWSSLSSNPIFYLWNLIYYVRKGIIHLFIYHRQDIIFSINFNFIMSNKLYNKKLVNYDYKRQYPPFYVSENMYKIVYINKYTGDDALKSLINHVENCNEYSIDTEGERSTGVTVLIQIETIPKEPPKIIMLFELTHLPISKTSKNLIKDLFHIMFRNGNVLYSWGNLAQEFSRIEEKDLLGRVSAESFDVQCYFSNWYDWARSSCESCSLSNRTPCHDPSPYRPTENWSLQRAMIYAAGFFIDKSITISNWCVLLDPKHTSLSKSIQQQRVNYAIYDCLATTYLAKAVRNYWTFNELTNKNINEIFISSSSATSSRTININNNNNNIRIIIKNSPIKSNKVKQIDGQLFGKVLNDDLEDISDDENEEIYLNQLMGPVDVEHKLGSADVSRHEPENIPVVSREVSISTVVDDVIQQPELIPDDPCETTTLATTDDTIQQVELVEINVDDILVIQEVQEIDEDQQAEPTQPEQKSVCRKRSRPAKIRHNRKHARQQKKHRFDHPIRRECYHRFKSFMIRKILRLYQIPFVHMKKDGDDVVVGLKNKDIQRQADHDLAINIFSRRSFFHYKNKYNW